MATTSSGTSQNAVSLQPFELKGLEYRNRIFRSSIGGRMANWDGQPTEVWKNFEKRFAEGGVGAIISTTLGIDEGRKAPFQYPSIADDAYLPRLKKYISEIKSTGCRYIIQIGDPGYAVQNSLFPESRDEESASSGFDLIFGYRGWRRAMTQEAIEQCIENFRQAARRVVETGADGIEVTAAKGYLIHQFLNPAVNRREDAWGGDVNRRFRFLEEVVTAVRKEVGKDFLFGVRIAAEDLNTIPLIYWLARAPYAQGNELATMLDYASRLKALGVDFFHVVSGFGFYGPRIVPGRFPTEEANIWFNHTSHLGFWAGLRSLAFNVLSRTWGVRALFELALQHGWKYEEAINLDYAREFRRHTGLTVIANGGFQNFDTINAAIAEDRCDVVSMARALIANPNLIKDYYTQGQAMPVNPCTHCNRCVGRTGTHPLGCYDVHRFHGDYRAMQKQILDFSRLDPL